MDSRITWMEKRATSFNGIFMARSYAGELFQRSRKPMKKRNKIIDSISLYFHRFFLHGHTEFLGFPTRSNTSRMSHIEFSSIRGRRVFFAVKTQSICCIACIKFEIVRRLITYSHVRGPIGSQ